MESESVSPEPSSFGGLLRRYRLAAGLSQETLAERARVSSQAIGSLERGDRRTPQRETLLLLIAALGLDDERRAVFEAAATRRASAPRPGRLVLEPSGWSAPMFGTVPSALTSFVGRDAEVADIARLLSEHRLVTLAGPGGIGKTRMSFEVAAAIGSDRANVRLVELAALSDASLVAATIASALGLQVSGTRPALETVRLHLQRERVLLIADNCEHVVDEAARVIEELLRACPLLHVLATSREPLRVTGEHVYRLPPLPTPALSAVPELDTTAAAEYPGVVLFVERAQAAQQKFALMQETVADVGEICARLDGLPLAIELAAARVATLPVSSIAQTLRRRFALLAHGSRTAPTRHQTMHAAIEWSYDLLSAPERDLFEKLAIFAGGWSLAMLVEVCTDDGASDDDVYELLSSLVEKSLVFADVSGGVPRYRLLDSFRHFALERLGSRGDARAIAHRHAAAALHYAERCDEDFERATDADIATAVRAELENVRAALEWSLRSRGDVTIGQRLACRFAGSLEMVSSLEARNWFTLAFESIDDTSPIDVVATLEAWAATRTSAYGDYAANAKVALRSASQLQSIGHPVGAARSTFAAGQALFFAGQYEEAKLLLERAVEAARSLECLRLSGHALLNLARTQSALGDAAAADAMSAQARLAYERCGSVTGLGHASFDRAEQAFRVGDAETALRRVMRALSIYRSREDDYVCGLALSNAAAYLTQLERFREAFNCASEALELGRATKSSAFVCALLHLTAIAALVPDAMADGQREHRLRHAASLLGYVEERFRTLGLELEYTEKHAFERIRATLDAAIAPPELAALLARGAAYTEDEACELGLSLEFVDSLSEAPTRSTYAQNGT